MIAGARYGHTNLIAKDWRALASFYQEQFGCTPVPPERDFPPVDGLAWPELLARLDRAHSALVDTVARMDDADFEKVVAGKDYTAAFMLDGLIQHNIYHAGQIALLKKGQPGSRP